MARPKKPIDVEVVKKLARLGCTQDEIADWFGVDQATISRRFSSETQLGRTECRISLRRWQMKRARGGSDAMLIHLGKHYLGQQDRRPESAALDIVGALDAADSRAEQIPGGPAPGAPGPVEG